MPNNAPGYIVKNLPRSTSEVLTKASSSHIKTIVKGCIQNYIKSFFDTTGVNRAILDSVSQTIQFDTDKSFYEDFKDPTKRHMQILRYQEDIRKRVPCILIVDNGISYEPSSFSLIGDARMTGGPYGGKWQGSYPIVRKVPLTLAVATKDEDTTDQLMSMLTWMFGELRVLAGGSQIQGDLNKGETWTIVLPQTFNIGVSSASDIQDDPKDKIWTSDISIEILYQDTIRIEQDWFTAQPTNSQTSTVNASDLRTVMTPIIDMPSSITVNQSTMVNIANLTQNHKVIIDDPNIATIDTLNWILTPRRLGNFKLQVIDISQRELIRQGLPPKVVAEKQITVIF